MDLTTQNSDEAGSSSDVTTMTSRAGNYGEMRRSTWRERWTASANKSQLFYTRIDLEISAGPRSLDSIRFVAISIPIFRVKFCHHSRKC